MAPARRLRETETTELDAAAAQHDRERKRQRNVRARGVARIWRQHPAVERGIAQQANECQAERKSADEDQATLLHAGD